MKLKAWTLAELTIIIIIILILTKASSAIVKNTNINKARIFTYVTIRNLTMGNIAIKEKYGSIYPASASTHDVSNSKDWYCLNLADSFSKEGTTNCSTTLLPDDDNFILANGVSIKGLSSSWIKAYDDLYYKNILIDINNQEGMNKIGIDKFPLRIFRGYNSNGNSADGLVLPVDCQSGKDILYDKDGNLISLNHNYCAGSSNFASNNEIFSYNTFRVTNKNNPKEANIIFAGKSVIEADCLANGGNGFYNHQICQSLGYNLHERCAHESTCFECETKGTCPNNSTETNCNTIAQSNKLTLEDGSEQGYKCFSLIAKPIGGMGLIGGAIMGEVGI